MPKLLSAVTVAFLMALSSGAIGQAAAAPLSCDTVTASECVITALHNVGAGGTFQVDRTLRIAAGGELRTDHPERTSSRVPSPGSIARRGRGRRD